MINCDKTAPVKKEIVTSSDFSTFQRQDKSISIIIANSVDGIFKSLY